MVVIGGRNSSNTTRLAEICAERCVRTHHIESVEELCADSFADCSRVGVTAGASTPEDQIQAVVVFLERAVTSRRRHFSSHRIPTPSCGVRSMATYPSSDTRRRTPRPPAASRRGASRAHRAGGARFACRRCGLRARLLPHERRRPSSARHHRLAMVRRRRRRRGGVTSTSTARRHGRAGARRGERTGVFRSTACCSIASSFAATPARSAL